MEFLDIAKAAAERWHERRGVREPNVAKIDRGMAIEAESVERIHARIHLLSEATQVVNREQSLIAAAAAGGNVRPLTEAIGLERVIGKKDFLDANFMEIGLAVARFVGRINIRSDSGRSIGYGTGFMVSPRLLLTNNHVLSSADVARASEVEFDYQNDRQGRLLPLVGFGLDPEAFFMTDKKLDFALVAVRDVSAGGLPLRRCGWSRLIGATGKAARRAAQHHPASARRAEADRAALERAGRPVRPVRPIQDGHGARFVGIAGLQRPVGTGGIASLRRPEDRCEWQPARHGRQDLDRRHGSGQAGVGGQ
jgi:hypothetical protein